MNNYIDNGNMFGLGMTCDVCGRTVRGITYVNGMKFCVKCYQETFGHQPNKIPDELLEELKETTELMNMYLKECIDKDHRIAVLELALKNVIKHWSNVSNPKEAYKSVIDQAEKELEGE